ncbi:syntaxin Ufe1p [Monosporozyma unispora]|nr:hypothetical protein C6P44_003936 [Kazachstania unispora]
MPNLTGLFQKYTSIVEESMDPTESAQIQMKNRNAKKTQLEKESLKDTFIPECRDLFYCLRELTRVLNQIESPYNDIDGSGVMSDQDKDHFDTEFRLQLQKYVTKFKQLESYETGREALIEKDVLKGSQMSRLIHSKQQADLIRFHKTNNQFRNGVINSINIIIKTISSRFLSMQQERLVNQKKFDTLDFNAEIHPETPFTTSESTTTLPISIETSTSHQFVETVQDEVKTYEDTISRLTQEQLQTLQVEHEELLNAKDEQLNNVKKINDTILDIMSLQTELSQHLQVQSQNINNMLDNQETIESNIVKGNLQLKKAQRTASKSAKMITYMAILMALFILFVDYIN